MAKYRALIIDDEPDIRELLHITLSRMDIDPDTAENCDEARRQLSTNSYNLCLTDMKLPDGNGIELVEYIQQHHPDTPVAMITAHGNMDTAVNAMKAGAFDFISKPIDLPALRSLISSALTSNELAKTQETEKTEILGQSEAVQKLNAAIIKLARSQASVYIFGESGSGKELVARSIHQLSPRRTAAFVPVNCGAIPAELMESEFFGHKKGSFTGASQDKQGLFSAAHGGTLFLDEIADLPLGMQVKLLRSIQEKTVRPVGAESEIHIDVRILCATHKNLEELVQEGTFRQDLFYRLNVIQLSVPPLRERRNDIPELTQRILEKLTAQHSITLPDLSRAAVETLAEHHYPGNVRELENILERALTMCENNIISHEDIHLGASPAVEDVDISGKHDHYRASQNYDTIDDYLLEIEKEILCGTLEDSRWNKTLAAKKLGISFRSLRYRLQKLGLDSEH